MGDTIRLSVGFAAAFAAVCVFGTAPSLATDDQQSHIKAAALLARAQKAIGAGTEGRTTKTLKAEGVLTTTANAGGAAPLPRRIAILAIVPSHYLRQESDDYGSRLNGFAENVLLSRFNARGGRATISGLGGDFQLQNERQEMARLLLGFFGSTAGLIDAKLSVVEPEGNALRVSASRFECVLELDSTTFVPVRVVYGGPSRNSLTPSQAASPSGDRTAATVISFEDRRRDRGLLVPYRIVRSRNGKTLEEVNFQSVGVNTPLRAADFTDR